MKILIIDDSNLLQTRLKSAILTLDATIQISQSRNCKEALEQCSSFIPDTIILDIALPDGSGIDLLRSFKRNGSTVRIIVLTNYPSSEFKKTCLDLGADQFFDKSNINQLLKIII